MKYVYAMCFALLLIQQADADSYILDTGFADKGVVNLARHKRDATATCEPYAASVDGKSIRLAVDCGEMYLWSLTSQGKTVGQVVKADLPFAAYTTGIQSVVVLGDGSIVAAGGEDRAATQVVKLTKQGSRDNGFGKDGFLHYNKSVVKARIDKIILHKNGTIFAAGIDTTARESYLNLYTLPHGKSGVAYQKIALNKKAMQLEIRDMTVDEHGGLLLACIAYDSDRKSQYALMRVTQQGELDTRFGKNALALLKIGKHDRTDKLTVQRDGKIIMAGRSGKYTVVARFTADGTLDKNFAEEGVLKIQFGYQPDDSRDENSVNNNNIWTTGGVHQLKDGGILLVGNVNLNLQQASHVFFKFTAKGEFDNSFGSGGVQIFNLYPTDFGEFSYLLPDEGLLLNDVVHNSIFKLKLQ